MRKWFDADDEWSVMPSRFDNHYLLSLLEQTRLFLKSLCLKNTSEEEPKSRWYPYIYIMTINYHNASFIILLAVYASSKATIKLSRLPEIVGVQSYLKMDSNMV